MIYFFFACYSSLEQSNQIFQMALELGLEKSVAESIVKASNNNPDKAMELISQLFSVLFQNL